MSVHVAIHDVSPRFASEMEYALALCRARDVRPSLLVVPNHHGRAPLDAAPSFVTRLHQLVEAGCEILLHGHYHQAHAATAASNPVPEPEQSKHGSLSSWFLQRVASDAEAEFGELAAEEAEARLAAGWSLLQRLGFEPRGFVPPAWILPQRLLPVLARQGVRYTEDHFGLYDPVTGRRRRSAVLNFATRSSLRLWSSVAYVRATKRLRSALPLRIAIHPGDIRSPLALGELVRLLDWARGHYVQSVAELFDSP